MPPEISRLQGRRLRSYYRSAGWPCLDTVEIDLLQQGLIERVQGGAGLETIRVTAAGLEAMGHCLARNRGAFNAHEALVAQVARTMASAGRLVFRSLTLRGRTSEGWRLCRPDVYSLRNTTAAALACPVIHEIKVRRADLLGDLANPAKRAAYQALSAEFYYVLPEGLATVAEIPQDCGVLFVTADRLQRARSSPQRAVEVSFADWMVIARRSAEYVDLADAQDELRESP